MIVSSGFERLLDEMGQGFNSLSRLYCVKRDNAINGGWVARTMLGLGVEVRVKADTRPYDGVFGSGCAGREV